jgi:hypothetical protein
MKIELKVILDRRVRMFQRNINIYAKHSDKKVICIYVVLKYFILCYDMYIT